MRIISFFITLLLAVSYTKVTQANTFKLPDLPEPVSNNAVAKVTSEKATYIVSFMGLGSGKTHKDVHDKVWMLKLGEDHWEPMPPVPSSLSLKGRLASIAIGIKDSAYIFGGYTVAEDHTEVSSPDNFRFDPKTKSYTQIAPMPVATDDAVALSYQDKYIYLISGWHNDGNVNLVQIYDIDNDTWQQASPFLGKPVFGHAGGIVDNKILVCDGVIVKAQAQKRRTFLPEPACYLGIIDQKQPTKIDWRVIPHPTGVARYRMAASGDKASNSVFFLGGSDNPYNYDGIGYDGKPSKPSKKIWIYNFVSESWSFKATKSASMDHRGLLILPEQNIVLTIGGMTENQTVVSAVNTISL
jgi:N-acetylneuraminic acid mutarotase